MSSSGSQELAPIAPGPRPGLQYDQQCVCLRPAVPYAQGRAICHRCASSQRGEGRAVKTSAGMRAESNGTGPPSPSGNGHGSLRREWGGDASCARGRGRRGASVRRQGSRPWRGSASVRWTAAADPVSSSESQEGLGSNSTSVTTWAPTRPAARLPSSGSAICTR
ncbi:hypothetical protein L7F22_040805 [Adiantum nelumboides]|nr:hypothetical protein [Adiantum nelumboides]